MELARPVSLNRSKYNSISQYEKSPAPVPTAAVLGPRPQPLLLVALGLPDQRELVLQSQLVGLLRPLNLVDALQDAHGRVLGACDTADGRE